MVIIVLAAAVCAVIGMLIELLAYRPLRNRPKLTVLITAIGVSLFIEYTCQHRAVFGAETRPFPQLLPHENFQLAGLSVDSNDVVVLVVTALLLAGALVHRATNQNRHGHARGCLQRPRRRADGHQHQPHHQLHLRPRFGARRGGGNFLCDARSGHRAAHGRATRVARVHRGGASAASAICRARRWADLLLGLLETFAGGVPGMSNYRDGIAFAILILILLFKPAGLLGKSQVEKV